MEKQKDKRNRLRAAIRKAVSYVTMNADKVTLVMDVLRILTTKSKDEVTQYSISMEYTTEEGKTYKLNLPKSKVKDSSELQNVIASIVTLSASDIGATIEEVIPKEVKTKSNASSKEEKETSNVSTK